ncbi:FlgN [Shewanella denitrificans OS217]|jgi:flagellar biosynthesis protein FlgN|uniref:FlgN n=1 Tax=Shewanella denitrificans (strain OS217 / ATCC BAA-1090 / DSM 15013) TaxID=318161 RepID=Q12PP2_SHEDO|nr:flagellar protein FlgN [Shewanella denitrificans]ABE54584.1 FlgN [Shewanella denitrificans OS217]
MTELLKLLAYQLGILAKLKTLIAEETQALHQRDADLLMNLAKDKLQCLNELQMNDTKLANHSENKLLSTEASLIEKVAQTKALLKECQDNNKQNASLIELNIASLNRFSQALQVSRNATSLTYNDKGKTSTISSLGDGYKA